MRRHYEIRKDESTQFFLLADRIFVYVPMTQHSAASVWAQLLLFHLSFENLEIPTCVDVVGLSLRVEKTFWYYETPPESLE